MFLYPGPWISPTFSNEIQHYVDYGEHIIGSPELTKCCGTTLSQISRWGVSSTGEGCQWAMVSVGHGSSPREDQSILVDQSKDKRRLSRWRDYGSLSDPPGDTCPTCQGIGRIPRGTLGDSWDWCLYCTAWCVFCFISLQFAWLSFGALFRSGNPTGGSYPLQWPKTETETHVSVTSTTAELSASSHSDTQDQQQCVPYWLAGANYSLTVGELRACDLVF